MLARMNRRHLEISVQKGKLFDGNSLVLVVADDVLHHLLVGQRSEGGSVEPCEEQAWGGVPCRVGDVEGVGSEGSAPSCA